MFSFRSKFLFILLSCVGSLAVAQVRQSSGLGTGNWSDPQSWNPTVVPTNANSSAIIINPGHIIQVDGNFTADQLTVNGTLQVNPTRVLTIANGTGDDLTIGTGTMVVQGELNGSNGWTFSGLTALNASFASGSVYRHFYTVTEGSIPIAQWNQNSTVEIVGFTSPVTATAGGNWGQEFGNFTYNCASQSYYSNVDFAGLVTTIRGSLIVSRVGGGATEGRLFFFNGQSGTLTVDGNVQIDIARVQFSTTGNVNLNFGGNFTFNAQNTFGSSFNSGGTLLADIAGNVQVAGGVNGKLFLAGSTVRVGGNWNVASGTVFGAGTLEFDGVFDGITPQTYSNTGTMSGAFNYIIDAPSALSVLANNTIVGSGSFTLNGTLILGSTDATGALVANTTNGNIRTTVGTRSFNNGSTIIYGGVSPQFIGTGHPTSSGVSTVIDNAQGVSLATAVTIGGNLELRSGSLNIASQTLTLSSSISGTGTIITSTNSNLTMNGSGNTTIPFAPSSILRLLTINRAASIVSIATQVTSSFQVALTNGDLNISGQQLILNGSLNVTTGRIVSNSLSTITINGSGVLGSALMFQPANQLGTLTVNRTPSGSVTLGSALTITNTLNLQVGVLANAGGFLTMANGSNLSRSSGGQLTGTRPTVNPGDRYNLIYPSGGVNSGLEMPNVATVLNNLTISGGSLVLGQALTVNGNFLLNSGGMTTGNFVVTMAGGSWTQNGGTYGPGLGVGVTVFSGTTAISGIVPVTFGHLQFNSSAAITMPATLSSVGNVTFQTGATIAHNSGIVLLNGSATQAFSAGGATLFNVTVNKTGGTQNLTGALSVLGTLLVQSATTVNSNGNLTLLSQSIGPSNNGSIGPIATGGSVVGNVNVQRFIQAGDDRNRYISPAVTNSTVAQIQASGVSITGNFTGTSFPCTGCELNGANLKWYNEKLSGDLNDFGYTGTPTSGGSNAQTLKAGMGYALYMWNGLASSTITMTAPINQGTFNFTNPLGFTPSHTVSVPAAVPSADGWNLLGNPYPSAIQWSNAAGWNRSNIDPTVWVWDVMASLWRSYNAQTSTGNLTNGIIAAGQGFWVYAPVPGDASITINESVKSSAGNGTYYRQSEPIALKISLGHDGFEDDAFLQIDDAATKLYEPGLDAMKLELGGERMQIAFLEEKMKLAYLGIANNFSEDISLITSGVTEGIYVIKFSGSKAIGTLRDYYLNDKLLRTSVPLTENLNYSFTHKPNESDPARFVLSKTPYTSIEETPAAEVYPNPAKGQLFVALPAGSTLNDAKVSNILGAVTYQGIRFQPTDKQSVYVADVSGLSAGLYFIMLKTDKGVFKKRIILVD